MTFQELRSANDRRNDEKFPECRTWSLCDWMTCLTGEIGEAANIIKKIKHNRFPCSGTAQIPVFENRLQARRALANELADVQIYLDLLAGSVGINLEDTVRLTFNTKSRELNSEVLL